MQTQVDRQLQRIATLLQHVVEAAFDPGKACIVDAGITDDMRGQIAVRIDAAILVLELQSRYAELIDGVLLAGRQVPLDPHKALVRGQLGIDLRAAEAWQRLNELLGRVGCV